MKIGFILIIYDTLINGGSIGRKQGFSHGYHSEKTFYRCIREISGTLIRHKPKAFIDVLANIFAESAIFTINCGIFIWLSAVFCAKIYMLI